MAIYHLSVKPISRSGGRSATAAAAYRSAEKIYDRTSGEIFDYSRKRGVEHKEIVLPTSAAKRDINWARDRQQLWNAAEEAENRKDARVAREYEVALPHELTRQQRLDLTREFSREIANRYGCAVDFSIHKPHRAGDERNHHAHILTTTRKVEAKGLGEKTEIEWKDSDRAKRGLPSARKEITAVRERWAEVTNESLKSYGHDERVDHRTLEAQGINREPTIHLGPAVTALQRRGITTQVEKRIEWDARENAQQRLALAAEIGRIERERHMVESRLLELNPDIAAAKRHRDLAATKSWSPAEARAQARERWLAMRDQLAKDKDLTPEQLRQQGREAYLKMREERQKGQGLAPDKSREQTKDNEASQNAEITSGKGKGRGGMDDDFSM